MPISFLERKLLDAFKTALRAGRPDVAEHVLTALETAQAAGELSDAAADAYLFIHNDNCFVKKH